MGKRGPQPGAAAERKRVRVARRLVLVSDREVVQAQRLNEHIEDFLVRIEGRQFPLGLIDPELVGEVVDSTAMLQGVIVEGIADRLLRDALPVERAEDEPGQMPKSYVLGQKRGRLP